MDQLTAAVILDILAKAGAMGAASLTIWALLSERLVPKGRLEDLRASCDKALEYRQRLLDEQEREIAHLHAELNKLRRKV